MTDDRSTRPVTAARDAASWAKSVARLNVADVPAGALNLWRCRGG